MRICLISVEIFAWGKYGGFGRATRVIGSALAERGHEVFAVVPRRPGQQPVEDLDRIRVLSFPPAWPWAATRLLMHCDADIYHSCEPSFATYLALRAMPGRKHMVTSRDPRNINDWRLEYQRPSLSKLQVLANLAYENNIFVRRSIRRMDAVYTTAHFLISKVKSTYGLTESPRFLPTPVYVPAHVRKAKMPTVCYVARLDRRKRPELFFDLAGKFPQVNFLAMGKSRDHSWETKLRLQYGNLPNLQFLEFVDQFTTDQHSRVFTESWIMVNTATREALPNSFLEAAAHRCAILSGVDPDGFASRFGYHVRNDDFAAGLAWLLDEERWKRRGELGYQYIQKHFELSQAIDRHLEAYHEILNS